MTGATPIVDIQNVNQIRVITKVVLEPFHRARLRQLRDADSRRDHEQLEPQHLAGRGRRHRLRLRLRRHSRRQGHGPAGDGERHVGDLAHRHRRHPYQLVGRDDAGTACSSRPTPRRSPMGVSSPTSYRRRAPTASPGRSSRTSPPRICRPTTSTTTLRRRPDRGQQHQEARDFSPSFGGPIAATDSGSTGLPRLVTDTYVGGLFYNQTPTAFVYTPDPTRPAVNDQRTYSSTLDVTLPGVTNHRLSVFGSYEKMCLCHFSISPTVAPEAATYNPGDSSIVQGRYTATLTNRLLFEAGASHYLSSFPRRPQPDATEPSLLEQATNLRFRSGAPISRLRRRWTTIVRRCPTSPAPTLQGRVHVYWQFAEGPDRVLHRQRELPRPRTASRTWSPTARRRTPPRSTRAVRPVRAGQMDDLSC